MTGFALYFHGGSGNKGCEAIVRSTSAMLKKEYAGCTVRLYSSNAEQDIETDLSDVDCIDELAFDESRLLKPITVSDKIRMKLYSRTSQNKADEYYYTRFYREQPLKKDNVFLSVGGDSYCYGENSYMNAMNNELKRLGKKTALWGCSLGKEAFTPYIISDLKTYNAIFVRETSSKALLEEHGFSENVYLHSDPAFTLATEKLALPDGFVEGETIGVNASPLVFKYEKDGRRGVALASYERLIEYILKETNCPVALIPHVFWDHNNDFEPLNYLYDKYKDEKRVVLIDKKLSAPQLKGYISRCKAFVGARTHATIAAYSSCVPTLVLGYSIKSTGIAKDIFGTSDGLVMPVDSLENENSLAVGLRNILDGYDGYKQQLKAVMPDYIASSYSAAKRLEILIK